MSHESTLQAALLLAAPAHLPALRLFRRNVIATRVRDREGRERTVRAGIAGQADLYALVRGGVHLEIELKNVGETLNPNQRIWRDWCVEWGIPHIVLTAKKGETTKETVERWLSEIGCAVPFHSPA